jgi:uncharacterized protein YaaW (UPF0174 family)
MHMNVSLQRGALLLLTASLACGSQPPTAPDPPTVLPPIAPPPVAPRSDSVDWEALKRLFADPLYRNLPTHLENHTLAEPLQASVGQLVASLETRNVDALEEALRAVADERKAYAARREYSASESILLLAMQVVELRANAFLGGVTLTGLLVMEGPSR